MEGGEDGGCEKGSEQGVALRRRAARMRRIDGPGITAEVLQDPFNDRRRLDAGDDAQAAAAFAAGLDVDGKDALESLRLSLIARCRSVAAASPRSLAAAAQVLGTIRARSGLAGANTPWYLVRCARGFGTSAASRAIKSSGSKITCVVPSRYGVFSA